MPELASITPVTEATSEPSYLFYGPPGAGKTIFAARSPGRKLWLDMDQKLGEIAQLPDSAHISVWSPHEPLGNPERIEIPHSPDAKNVSVGMIPAKRPQGYEKLVNVTNELLTLALKKEPLLYDVIVLDSLTAAAEHWQSLLMYTHKVSFMTERLWGIYLAGLKEYIDGFLQLPAKRIVICHDKSVVDEDTKFERIRPSIAGQLGNNLTRYFTEAYYFLGRDRSGAYKIQTVTDSRISARTSRGLEPTLIADPAVYTRR